VARRPASIQEDYDDLGVDHNAFEQTAALLVFPYMEHEAIEETSAFHQVYLSNDNHTKKYQNRCLPAQRDR
jgi:hypothetical protein